MCYDTRSSAATFIIGLISAIFIKYLPLKLFVYAFTLMQLYEFMIWSHSYDSIENKIGTAIGKYALPFHATAFGLGIYLTTGDYIPLIFGVLSYILVLTLAYDNTILGQTEIPENGKRIVWPFCQIWYLGTALLIILSTLIYSPTKYKIMMTLSYAGTVLYAYANINSEKEFGSVWCFSAAYIAPFLALADNMF
uniref:Uncharacterized protein n=1 Tax=viral metagenome TaxID=1070528 RepID=A0A6C0JAL2_9ZZZZ